MSALERYRNFDDFRKGAQRRLPHWLFEAIEGGTEDGLALRRNRAAFERIRLYNRVLKDISNRNLGMTFLGKEYSLPLAVAPTGIVGLCWYRGETELARACGRMNVPYTLATNSLTRLEEVAQAAEGELWFQLYMLEDKAIAFDLVRRAAAAGYSKLVITVDFGLGANREYNFRNGFSSPFRPGLKSARDILLRPNWLRTVLLRYLMTSGMPENANLPKALRVRGTAALRAERITWDDFREIRDVWKGPVIVKGIVHPEDATAAVAAGVDAIVVSNHGGRNMDSAIASIDALPGVVSAVAGKADVLLDSGIRRGSDIAKARALGAKGVMVGRAALWGVAVAGASGAERMLDLLAREYELTLAFLGCSSGDELSPEVIAEPVPD